jgi:hypothetical protein
MIVSVQMTDSLFVLLLTVRVYDALHLLVLAYCDPVLLLCVQPKSPVLAHYHDSDLEDSDASDSNNKLEGFSLDYSSHSNTAAHNTVYNTVHNTVNNNNSSSNSSSNSNSNNNSTSNSNSISNSLSSSVTVDRSTGNQIVGRTAVSTENTDISAAVTVATAVVSSSSSDDSDRTTSAEIEAFAKVNIVIYYLFYSVLQVSVVDFAAFTVKQPTRATVG